VKEKKELSAEEKEYKSRLFVRYDLPKF